MHISGFPFLRLTSIIAIALLLGGCSSMPGGISTSEQESLQSLVSMQDRLDRVAAPLLLNNPDLCKGNARNLLGFTAKNKYSYSEELAGATKQAFGLDERLQVVRVLPGGGAARAGVRKGDGLIAIDDNPLPQGAKAERQAATIIAPLVIGKTNVKLTVLRAGTNVSLSVPLTPACAFSVELGNADNTNAYADGRRIVITRGMMKFAQTDNELAYVVAKEMAHNILDHPSKHRISGTMGEIIDNLVLLHPDMSTMGGMAGIKPYTQELDAAADTLSLYLIARAGYSVNGAMPFWSRLAQQYPASVLNGYTAIHPATKHRMSVMDKMLIDLKSKQGARKPLVPMT